MRIRIASWAVVTDESPFSLPAPLAKAMRRADDFSRYAAMAAVAAQAWMPFGDVAPVTGIFLASCHGPMETGLRFMDSIEDKEPSPIRFTHSVHNVASGYIALALQSTGPVLTLTSFHWPLLVALDQALQSLESGRVQRAMVLAVEMNGPFLEAARMRPWPIENAHGDQPPASQFPHRPSGGAVAWVLEPSSGPGPWLQNVTHSFRPCDLTSLLLRQGESWSGPGLPPGEEDHPTGFRYPLDHALTLTRGLDTLPNTREQISWRLSAPFGEACLTLIAARPPSEAS